MNRILLSTKNTCGGKRFLRDNLCAPHARSVDFGKNISSAKIDTADFSTAGTTSKIKNLRSSPNETTVDDLNTFRRESCALKLDPRAVFPWRHSPLPLPRLVPGTEEFETQGGYIGPHLPPLNAFLRGLNWVNSAGFLGAKIFQYGSWKEDLEYAFMHAFAVSVQGLLHDVYKIPPHGNGNESCSGNENENVCGESEKDDLNGDEDADVNPPASSFTESNPVTEGSSDNADDIDHSSAQDFPIDFTHIIKPEDEYRFKHGSEEVACNYMLEPTLISLYRSAHTYCKHKLQIKLRSKPKSAQIQSLFLVPFLTRAEVEDNISLKHSFRNIVKALHHESQQRGRELSYFEIGNIVAEQLDIMSANQMMRRRKSGHDEDVVQMTVISQVAIQCDEIFVVRDTDTGDIVQGDAKENTNEVTHLVRFETVIDLDMETRETQIVGWQITDWDDLLDGNIWFS
jgi:hypothetical protein